jgi:predicted nuclease of predicted toxin-antitoxin system
MKFVFDQNISHRILKLLPDLYADSVSVKNEALLNASDAEIWDYAKKHERTIITQDADFNDLNALRGFPPKIIWIRAGNLKTTEVAEILSGHVEVIEEFVHNQTHGCFEIFRLHL